MDTLYSQKSEYNLKSQPPASEAPLQVQSQPTADYVVLCVLSRVQLCDPVDCSPPGSSVHGDSPGKNTRVGCHLCLLH